jgi:ribosomal protein L11 methyltransferase
MSYIEIKIIASSEFSEILMAELGEIGFETFTEEADGLNAYIPEDQFDKDSLDEVFVRYPAFFECTHTINTIEKQNWNAEWEKNYPPIRVGDQILVRASFHEPDQNVPYDIVINPKMSFGTGHHETTSMVMAIMLDMATEKMQGNSFAKKSVLDIGCGTNILAILAEKLGATELSAFDIEEWAAENSRENAELNGCKHITVRQGTIEDEPLKQYDIILANINRNILLRDINQYINYLKPGGAIIISGFYTTDQADIETKFAEFGLKKIAEKAKNNWASVRFELN